MPATTKTRRGATRWPMLLIPTLLLTGQAAAMPQGLAQDWQAAAQGQLSEQAKHRWRDDVMAPWLEAIDLGQRLPQLRKQNVADFLRRYPDLPAAAWLREHWLVELARREDWSGFLAYDDGNEGVESRCRRLLARRATGAEWQASARELWQSPSSLPASCDALFESLQKRGGIDPGLRWQRIEAAAAAGQAGLVRFLAKGLSKADAALALDYATFLEAPSARALAWPRDARSRKIVVTGLAGLARRDPDQAELLLGELAGSLLLEPAELGTIRYAIALWTAADYAADAARRFAAVPAAAFDRRLHEWQVRAALARGEGNAALQALTAMPTEQRSDPRWQYFEARLREPREPEAARALYRAAATSASFHGFLAADRLQQAYRLCPLQPPADPTLRDRVAALPGLRRALTLFELGRSDLAEREWQALLAGLDRAQRLIAIELAQQAHWYDRAIFSLGNDPELQRQYALRFPLHHAETLRQQAQRNGLDPAFVAGLTRAESGFMPHARSQADARGLMQLVPATAAQTARRLGLPWHGADSLYQAATNLTLGTAALRHELDRHDGLPYLAIAAYNAGPTPVERWRAQRPRLDPDFWIETIAYGETRDYVARVLAFSVIYDWRMNGKVLPLSDRLLGRPSSTDSRREVVCFGAQGGAPP